MKDLTHEYTGEGQPVGEVAVVGAGNALVIDRVDGRAVADVVAGEGADDGNEIGGIPIVHKFFVVNTASGNVDAVLQHKERVIDAHLVKVEGAGGASDTIQVQDGSGNAISNAMSINVADQAVVRAGTIDDAFHTINAGGTLRVRRNKASANNTACIVYITCLRIA